MCVNEIGKESHYSLLYLKKSIIVKQLPVYFLGGVNSGNNFLL